MTLIIILAVLIAVHKPKSMQPETVQEHGVGKRSLPGEKMAPHTLLGESAQYDTETLNELLQQRDPFKPRR